MTDTLQRRLTSPAAIAGWIGLALVVVGIAGFVAIYDWVREGEDLAAYDQAILDVLVSVRSAPLTWLLTAITTISGPVVLPVVIGIGALVAGFRYGRWREVGLLVGAMVTAMVVSTAFKVLIGRARPAEDLWVVPGAESSASFPSGHTIGTATFLLVLGYLHWVRYPSTASALRWGFGAVLGMGLVAFSRLYLGYHWATDTVASMALAVAVLGGVMIVDRRRAGAAPARMRAEREAARAEGQRADREE